VAGVAWPTNSAWSAVIQFWMDKFINSKSEQAHFIILFSARGNY
jgi:hypothetical protein